MERETRAMTTYNVSVKHDPEIRVYYIEDSDIPGLHAESASADELFEIVHDLAADLVPKEDLAEASIQFHGLPAHQALTPVGAASMQHRRRARD
jgi:hypothetical protein